MLLRQIYDTTLAQAAYLVGCQRTGEALLIDPERDVDRYIDIAASEGLRISAITETHIHADFLSGARELAERTGARLYLSGEGGPDWQYEWVGSRSDGGAYDHVLLRDGQEFSVGNIRITALHTPGHTPEHMSFMVTDIGGGASEPMGIATGDFVFVGDVGRPDLLETAAGETGAKEPSARVLFRSLRQFVTLPEYLQVWPGHGAGSACGKALGAIPQSTVGYEKRFNASVAGAAGEESAFVASILAGQPDPPLYFARMKRENRTGPRLLGTLPQPHRATIAEAVGAAAGGAVVVDTRGWSSFAAGHVAGSLHLPVNKSFPTVAGSYIDPEATIWIVAEEARVHDAVLGLVRVGLDHIVAYVTPEDVEEWIAAGNGERIAQVAIDELVARIADGSAHVLDVRAPSEYDAGHVAGAQNIVHTRLAAGLATIPRDVPLYVHCQSGIRAAYATALLAREGLAPIYVAGGGYPQIAAAGAPTGSGATVTA